MQHINECVLLIFLEPVFLNRPHCASNFINAWWKWPVPGTANKYETSCVQAGAAASKGVGSLTIAGGHQSTAIAIAAWFCDGGVRRNGWWMSRYELRKILAWETWTKTGVVPGLYLVPCSRKYANNLDEIDPVHVLPPTTVKVRQMQHLLSYLSDIVIFKF